MRFLKTVSHLNKKIPKLVRFIIGLVILNIPPIVYLSIVGAGMASIYFAVIFLVINVSAWVAHSKIKEIEVESPMGKIRIKR